MPTVPVGAALVCGVARHRARRLGVYAQAQGRGIGLPRKKVPPRVAGRVTALWARAAAEALQTCLPATRAAGFEPATPRFRSCDLAWRSRPLSYAFGGVTARSPLTVAAPPVDRAPVGQAARNDPDQVPAQARHSARSMRPISSSTVESMRPSASRRSSRRASSEPGSGVATLGLDSRGMPP